MLRHRCFRPLPYSPGLNPIEHAWVLLKRQAAEDCLDLPRGADAVTALLAEVLPICWEEVPETQFEKLWKLMPDRVQAVIEANGWQARY